MTVEGLSATRIISNASLVVVVTANSPFIYTLSRHIKRRFSRTAGKWTLENSFKNRLIAAIVWKLYFDPFEKQKVRPERYRHLDMGAGHVHCIIAEPSV